jgi:hypothetical protein
MKVSYLVMRSERILGNAMLTFCVKIGEVTFDDHSHEPSGAATPIDGGEPPAKKKKGLSKKAKTVKQRLAVIDGEVG